jgi:manganese oxidase
MKMGFSTARGALAVIVALATLGLGACASKPAGRLIEVTINDDGGNLRFEPSRIEVSRGDTVRWKLGNATLPHNIEFVRNGSPDGTDLGDVWSGPYLSQPGETYDVVIDDSFVDGTYSYVCTPHVSLGMAATMVVSGGTSGSGAVASAAGAPAAAASARPEIRGVHGLQPLAWEMDGDIKVFRLTAEKIRWETKEGTVVDAMAYNRMIPGPTIRATEGERVRIIVTNGMDEPHTTHWHGMFVPIDMDGVPGISQNPIMPGDSFTYEFVANPAGTRLYHSHFNAMTQEGKGLYGMFIVDERDPPAARRADREEIMLLADGMGYVINGKEFPMTQPIHMKMGERIRVRIANLGAMYHPMHMHGGFMTVIAKDGFPVPAPQQINTVSVAPGDTWDVILAPQFAGTWIWHCHVLAHATGPKDADGNETAAGMIGVIIVDDGQTVLADMSNHRNH